VVEQAEESLRALSAGQFLLNVAIDSRRLPAMIRSSPPARRIPACGLQSLRIAPQNGPRWTSLRPRFSRLVIAARSVSSCGFVGIHGAAGRLFHSAITRFSNSSPLSALAPSRPASANTLGRARFDSKFIGRRAERLHVGAISCRLSATPFVPDRPTQDHFHVPRGVSLLESAQLHLHESVSEAAGSEDPENGDSPISTTTRTHLRMTCL